MEVKIITLRTGLVVEQKTINQKTTIKVIKMQTDTNGNKIYAGIKRLVA